jgi:hypothetical protein
MNCTPCWEKILRELTASSVEDETPAEGKPFTATLEDSGIAIYLGQKRWSIVSKQDFDSYFEWYDYCAKHNFDKPSRIQMKSKIRDAAESSSYIFSLIRRFCKS